MSTSVVLTVVADDHPGIVETLSEVLTRHGGNWTESSMMTLAGKFAGILLVQVATAEVDAFISALEDLEASGLKVIAQRSGAASIVDEAQEFSIELVGQDHPGIVQELETTVQSASMSGESLFMAHARIIVPTAVSLDQLQDEMEELANELMVDIKLEE
jgi:glycine cleavage system regulatory protein